MLNSILSFGKSLSDFILLFWFSTLFFNLRFKTNKIIPFVVILCVTIFLYLVNILHIPQINTITALICALIINISLFTGHYASRLLCSILEILLFLTCEFIPVSIYSVIENISMPTVINETIKNAGFSIISTGLSSIIIILVRYAITLKRRRDDKEVTISENIAIITVPLVSILTIYYILFIHTTNVVINEKFPMHSLFIFSGILLMNIVVIIGDDNLRRQYQLQRELDRINRLEQLNRLVIEQQDQYIDELKGFAHDYAKQMEGIKKLITSKDGAVSNELQTYSEEMIAQIENSYRFAFIPSPALRTILSQAQLRCNASQITFDVDIQYADFSFISFPDLYTLFENPLENAITACKALKENQISGKIKVTIFRKRNMIWVKIKNSMRNPVIKKNNIIQSTKKDPSRHGLGLKNMQRVIKQYGGHINIEYTSSEFSLTMALPIPSD